MMSLNILLAPEFFECKKREHFNYENAPSFKILTVFLGTVSCRGIQYFFADS